MSEREIDWSDLMRAANDGDEAAYDRLLRGLTPWLRSAARRNLARAGMAPADAEDLVQETLLAIHLKRHTWNGRERFMPWISAIARHKLIDALRRRGRKVHVSIDDFAESLPAIEDRVPAGGTRDAERHLQQLPTRQRDVVRAIAVDGGSVRDTAGRLAMTEGAVRVALHRGLAALAAKFRTTEP